MNPELPGTYVNLLVDLIEKKGISAEKLLTGTGIVTERLKAPFWYIDFNIFNFLLEKAAFLMNEPAIAIHLAQEMKISCYGHVGIAASASENLGEAIEVLTQYIGLHCSAFKPKLKIKGEIASLYFKQPLQNFRLNAHGIIFLVLGFTHLLESLVQQKLNLRIEFQQTMPEFYQASKNTNKLKTVFDCKEDSIIFDKQLLTLALKTADKLTARLAKAQCKQDIKKLSSKRLNDETSKSKVKAALYDELDGFLSLKQVAAQLLISERTLQRQLHNEKTTFQILVTEVRKEQAERLLQQQRLSIQDVAHRLGYADISHFSRAFKKWTNLTPTFYREVISSSEMKSF
ncbi:MAG: AraC family transcriptional regulator ligand-binding domain-containing protein [Acinetobacter sp.]